MAKTTKAVKYDSTSDVFQAERAREFDIANDNRPSKASNVTRIFTAANDNRPQALRSIKKPTVVSNTNSSPAVKLAEKVAQAELVWPIFVRTLTFTSVFYLSAQLYLGILSLIGTLLFFGIDSSYTLSAADLVSFGSIEGMGLVMYIIGIVGSLLCGLLTFIVSFTLFVMRGIKCFRGFSLLVLVLCTVGLLIPVLNIFPVMWFWNWYVAWTNLKN